MSSITVSTILSSLLLVVSYTLLKRLTRSKRPLSDVAGPESEHWLKGNYHRIFQDGFEYNLQLAEKYGGVVKIRALFNKEQLYVSDPLALYYILVKEQNIYEETDMFIMGNKLIFGEGLLSTLGQQHRKQRKILNPVFSMGNMRKIHPVVQPIATKLCDKLVSMLPTNGESTEINIMPWISRMSLDYIGKGGLGHNFNALDTGDAEAEEYTAAVQNFSSTVLRLIFFRPFIPLVLRNFSLYWRNKIMDWAPITALKEFRKIVDIMDKGSQYILTERKRTFSLLEESSEQGRDIMSIMLQANSSSSESDRLTEGEILGQISSMIFGGAGTTSLALNRLLYTLAAEPDVQRRLRSEVRRAKCLYAKISEVDEWQGVYLPYDELMALPYLDAVVRESLRLHPPSSLFARTLRQPTILPLQYPVCGPSGRDISSLTLPANTNVIISILAANHNKKVWGEDASTWRPERWLAASGERLKIVEGAEGDDRPYPDAHKNGVKFPGVYSSMMTFMGGSRACIGFKFAEMEIKQTLTTLISRLSLNLPTALDAQGNKKIIYWKMNGAEVPVVLEPTGDGNTEQIPLDIRLVTGDDFN